MGNKIVFVTQEGSGPDAEWLTKLYDKAAGLPNKEACQLIKSRDFDGRFTELAVDAEDFTALCNMCTTEELPSPVRTAFISASEALAQYDSARSSFLSKLWESFIHREQLFEGEALASATRKVEGQDDLKVSVKRFGLVGLKR